MFCCCVCDNPSMIRSRAFNIKKTFSKQGKFVKTHSLRTVFENLPGSLWNSSNFRNFHIRNLGEIIKPLHKK